MNIEMIVQNTNTGKAYDVSDLISDIEFSQEIQDNPGKLTFNIQDVLNGDYISEGSPVSLKVKMCIRDRAKADVCTYCNISTIPPGLINIVANIAFDYINLRVQSKVNDDKEVKSIQEGDTTITFNSNSTKIKSKKSIFDDYLVTLNKFRVMVF